MRRHLLLTLSRLLSDRAQHLPESAQPYTEGSDLPVAVLVGALLGYCLFFLAATVTQGVGHA